MNALSGLQNRANSIYCRKLVGLISVAHQAVLRLSSVSSPGLGGFFYSLTSRLALFGLNAATTSGAVSTYGPSSN
ncbi:hypothetical protein CRG94_21125 [Escherichia sp. E3356]|nr:hypothetical protein CRG94_21125 [Escherichia sp. E3356]